jgi:putative membrane protein
VLALVFGTWLWLGFGFAGGWLWAKLVLVLGLVLYHFWCGRLLAAFAAGRSVRNHVWFRFFNEIPVLALVAVCILVVVKPF